MGHLHEKIDYVVGLFVVFNDKVLLVDHKKLNKWVCLGGHVELDEDPEQALFRELEEESGLRESDIEVLTSKPKIVLEHRRFVLTPNYVDMHDIDDVHKHVSLVYFIKSKTDKVALEESAHRQMKWVGKDELENPVYNFDEGMKFYIQEAIKKAQI